MYRVYLLIISFQLVFSIKDGLYATEDDDVVPLNDQSFQANVLKNKSDLLWVVEFYNSWCGHCIHFAPTWKELAVDLKDWRDLVVIAAIDCSQESNLETCRKYDINSYPTLKIFPPTSVKDGKSEIIKSQDLNALKKLILDFMLKNAPESWPHLQPLEKIEDIWQEKKDNHEHVVLIFEEAESPVGSQVIIDLRKTPSVLVRRMLKDNVVKYGITKFPSLYKLSLDSTYTMLAVGSKMLAEDRAAFVQTIKDLAAGREAKNGQLTMGNGQNANLGLRKEHHDSVLQVPEKYNSSVVSLQDLESALHYCFRQEVAIRKTIDGEKFPALQRFVGVLLKYFPGRKHVLGFLKRVNDMLSSLKSANITGEEWMSKIDSLQDKDNFLPEIVKWESCQGSSPRFRGYPCSMWTLFHTLTVASYSQNLGTRHGIPQEVLVAIRDYMKHFFGCHECSTNFLTMAHSIEEEVHNHKDAVLWLWSAHNKANKRLHGDASEDPEHPKIQFPSDKICPRCHTLVPADEGTKFSWDTENVLEFLVNFYSEKSIVSSKNLISTYRPAAKIVTYSPIKEKEVDWWESVLQEQDLKQVQLLRGKKRETVERNTNKQTAFGDNSYYSEETRLKQDNGPIFRLWGLTHVDFSLCVIFYLLSTVIILTLYHHFIVRRRMMPCKNI